MSTLDTTAQGAGRRLGAELAAFGRFLLGELKPKGKLLTPFNVISVPVTFEACL